ncbi:MAG: radical SAM protein [bacterium]|nr:radical SAM protein [bacterium]
MRVALVKVLSAADEVVPPFGLGYLADAVRRRGHEAAVVDALRDGLGEEALVSRLAGLKPDLVGVLLFSKDLRIVRSLLRAVRAAVPGTKTCIGGPHPSAVPSETMEYFGETLDFAFAGEAETGLPMLMDRLRDGKAGGLPEVPGLIRRTGGGVLVNPRVFKEDLDALAVAWDLIPPDSYPRAPHGAYYRQFPVAPVVTSRGCPFQSTFCAAECVSGRKVRRRSVENVVSEIEMLRDRYGVREIHIEDDNFTGKKEYVLAFCEALRRRVPGISWTCPNGVRVDTLDREMLAAMKASGLYFLSIGVESGSDRILKAMKKYLTVARIEEKVRIVREAGIDVSGFFMLGFPGETPAEMEETIRLALRLPLARASFANFQPFPGCEEFARLRDLGELPVDWESFEPTLQSTTYAPSGTTTEALRALRKRALWRFYGRPKVAWGMLRGIRSLEHAGRVLRRGWRWLTIGR